MQISRQVFFSLYTLLYPYGFLIVLSMLEVRPQSLTSAFKNGYDLVPLLLLTSYLGFQPEINHSILAIFAFATLLCIFLRIRSKYQLRRSTTVIRLVVNALLLIFLSPFLGFGK